MTARDILTRTGLLPLAADLRERFDGRLLYVEDLDTGEAVGSLAALGDGPESNDELKRRVLAEVGARLKTRQGGKR